MKIKRKALHSLAAFILLSVASVVAAETLTLGKAVQQALETNPVLLLEKRETDARERQVREALGGFYPTVDLVAGYGFQERDPSSQRFADINRTRNELERSEAQLSVSQLVYDGSFTEYEHENQKSRLQSQEHRTSSVAEDIALSVIEAYLGVLKQETVLLLAKETLDTHQKIYDKMYKRFDSGVGSRADLDQISGRLALAKTNYINQTANLNDAKVSFQRVVGYYPAEQALVSPGTYQRYLPGSAAEAVEKAVQNHPLLKSANTDIESVSYQYQQTKSSFYPSLRVELERDLNKNVDGLEGQVDDLRVMLRMRYNLYRGRSDVARKQRFAYLVEKAKEIRNNTRRQVEQEVRLAWITYRALRDQLPALEGYVTDSSSTKKAYIKQFDLGRRTLLDLLNTENEMIEAKRSLAVARYDSLFNEYRLFHSMGELLYTFGAKF